MHRIFLVSVLLACRAGVAAEPLAPVPTLTGRLCAVLEGNAYTNTSARAMRLLPTVPTNAPAVWPFKPEVLEARFERLLVKGSDGRFRLPAFFDLPHDATGLAAPEASVRYINQTFTDWAVGQLDARFPRAPADVVRRLAESIAKKDRAVGPTLPVLTEKGSFRVPHASLDAPWMAAWRLDVENYFLLAPAQGDRLARRRHYFVLWDGRKDWPVAYFDQFPDARRAWSARCILTAAAACNDLPVYLEYREANRSDYDAEYVEMLLREALKRGVEPAAWNLGILLERRGAREAASLLIARGAQAFEAACSR